MPSSLIELPGAGLMLAHGPQAVDLLHAQLTQELRDWPAATARMAALCTPQGRMLADFLLWREADGGVAMLLDAELLEPTLKRLRMFILRLKCTLDDARGQRRVYGLLEDAEAVCLLPGGELPVWGTRTDGEVTAIRLPDAPGQRRTLLVAAQALDAWEPVAGLARATQDAWRLAELRAGIGHIGPATVQQFVPQMLNYELLGAVDFHKGCYPGQEIVARTQYRGSIKRRTFAVRGDQAMRAGDEVFSAADPGQPCGLVVGAAPSPEGGWEGLAELKLEAAAQAALHLGAATGPQLRLGSLPYELPAAG
jgi:folate-binding protein YgfZ